MQHRCATQDLYTGFFPTSSSSTYRRRYSIAVWALSRSKGERMSTHVTPGCEDENISWIGQYPKRETCTSRMAPTHSNPKCGQGAH